METSKDDEQFETNSSFNKTSKKNIQTPMFKGFHFKFDNQDEFHQK